VTTDEHYAQLITNPALVPPDNGGLKTKKALKGLTMAPPK
jgi:hypothetical protein